MIHNSKFFDNFGQVICKFPNIDLTDLFSKGQIESKRWLVNELLRLNLNLGTIFICAGWYGSLATFLFENNFKLQKVRSFDIDPQCADIAETFNRSWVVDNWKFKATTLNIENIAYPLIYETKKANGSTVELIEEPDTIINTSCEHIENFKDWFNSIPSGKLVILQSNNYFEITDHINCVSSLEEFSNQTPMSNLLYQGELNLEKYTRFMRIGYK